jgi:hypothetical protein
MPWWQLALHATAPAAGAAAAGAALWLRHRARRLPPGAAALAEVERALRVARRPAGTPRRPQASTEFRAAARRPPASTEFRAAAVTLRALESAFSSSPGAAGYLRALRRQRYAAAATAAQAPPTAAQRRALRSAVARGGGLRGRLRAWWALPPRRSRR